MCNVLVVEDEHILRSAIVKLLDQAGYCVVPAGTVKEASLLIEEHVFDIALIDLTLPNGDGVRVIEKIQGGIETIIVTGFLSEHDLNCASRLGVSATLEKPYDEEELIALIDNIRPREDVNKKIRESHNRNIGDSVDLSTVYSKLATVSARVQQALAMKGDISELRDNVDDLKDSVTDLVQSVETVMDRTKNCERRGIDIAILKERSNWQKELSQSTDNKVEEVQAKVVGFFKDNQGYIGSAATAIGFVIYLVGKSNGWW